MTAKYSWLGVALVALTAMDDHTYSLLVEMELVEL